MSESPGIHGPEPLPRGIWTHRAAECSSVREPAWLWPGYLARGETTLLTSQWKTGKTTLVSVLLAKLARGEEFMGQQLPRCKGAVVSEERLENWLRRDRALRFDDSVCLFSRPFRSKPSDGQWRALIDQLGGMRREGQIDLVVIDPLASFLPSGCENQPDRLSILLRPLEQITDAGAALLLVHHPRKGRQLAGQAARGSGALCAYADILLEMRLLADATTADRRRLLAGFSRHDRTPAEAVLELSADGTTYLPAAFPNAAAPPAASFESSWLNLEAILDGIKLTRKQIARAWTSKPIPCDATLWQWLKQALAAGRLEQEGSGNRGDPRRYWIKGQTATWSPDYEEILEL